MRKSRTPPSLGGAVLYRDFLHVFGLDFLLILLGFLTTIINHDLVFMILVFLGFFLVFFLVLLHLHLVRLLHLSLLLPCPRPLCHSSPFFSFSWRKDCVPKCFIIELCVIIKSDYWSVASADWKFNAVVAQRRGCAWACRNQQWQCRKSNHCIVGTYPGPWGGCERSGQPLIPGEIKKF